MPKPKDSIVDFDVDLTPLRNLGRTQSEIQLICRFSGDGVLDFDGLTDQAAASIGACLGMPYSLDKAGRYALKMEIAQAVVEQGIRPVSDVLADFDEDGEPYLDSKGQWHIPLRMKGSGRKLDLTPRFDANCNPDLTELVDSFEMAYREVMIEVVLDLVPWHYQSLLSQAQQATVRHHGAAWLAAKISGAMHGSVEFELITDGSCWLRGGGQITVRLIMDYGQSKFVGEPRQIKVYSTDKALFDPKHMAEQLAGILSAHLQDSPGRGLFSGAVKAGLMTEWEKQAKQWLVEDIQADNDLFAHFKYWSSDGDKILVGREINRELFEMKIKFMDDGKCSCAYMAFELFRQVENKLGVEGVLSLEQRSVAEKAIARSLVHAVRHKRYCYPYSQDTKNKLLGMAKYIRIVAADIHGISPLALAGAVADALDDNLADRIQEAYDTMERNFLEAVGRHSEDIADLIPLILTLMAGPAPAMTVALTTDSVGLAWALLDDRQKNQALVFTAAFLHNAVYYLDESVDISIAKARDEHSDALVEYEIKASVDPKGLDASDAAKLRKEWSALVRRIINYDQVMCYYLCGGSQYSGKVMQNAQKIQQQLTGCKKMSSERSEVTKWERFYHYFA